MARRRLPALGAEDRALWDALKQGVTPLKSPLQALPGQIPTPPTARAPTVAVKRPQEKSPATPDLVWEAPGQFAATIRSMRPQTRVPQDLRAGGSRGLDRANAERLRRGKMPIEGRLDLHGMTQDQAQDRLEGFIVNAAAAGKRHLLVITGKGASNGGRGVLRTRVPEWLGNARLGGHVLAFSYAQKRDGEQGALYVLLRRAR